MPQTGNAIVAAAEERPYTHAQWATAYAVIQLVKAIEEMNKNIGEKLDDMVDELVKKG